MPKHMSKEEEQEYYEQNKEANLLYIRAKLPCATPKQLCLIAALIQGLGVVGWSAEEGGDLE